MGRCIDHYLRTQRNLTFEGHVFASSCSLEYWEVLLQRIAFVGVREKPYHVGCMTRICSFINIMSLHIGGSERVEPGLLTRVLRSSIRSDAEPQPLCITSEGIHIL